ncbi:acyltransferase, partial [Absiella sp. AM54-8XD]
MDNTICVNSKRLIWLDQLKAISMYLVILGHSLLKFKKHLMFKVIYSFHMPLF